MSENNVPFDELDVEQDDVMDTSNDVMSTGDDLDSLGDFALDDLQEFAENAVKETNLPEDTEGFSSGFPAWDLHPPKSEPKKK